MSALGQKRSFIVLTTPAMTGRLGECDAFHTEYLQLSGEQWNFQSRPLWRYICSQANRAALALIDADFAMSARQMDILLVEDDEALVAYIKRGLSENGHSTEHASRGDRGFELAGNGKYDLLIVDRMLPGLDGLLLIKMLRQQESCVPILILSNLGGLDDRVEGLNAGADDYLAKPFAFSELLARVNALLRRPHQPQEQQFLKIGDMEMDRINRKVTRAGIPIPLQPREFALLEYLLKLQGQIVTRTMLLDGVWNYNFNPQTHIVETHMSRLRSKVGADLIHTVRGSGYTIRAPKSDS